MNSEQKKERKENLQNLLKDHFKISFVSNISNIDSPLLLILDYSSNDKNTNLVSFGFSLSKYYEGIDTNFENRFWTTKKTRSPEQECQETPHFHKNYKEFDSDGRHFYPFSAQLNDVYSFSDLSSMKSLLSNLYGSIDFT